VIKIIFRLKDKYVDSGAKKLAGIFGISFIVMLILVKHIGFFELSYVIGGVFMLCSLLDALMDYCLGCKIYVFIKKIYPNFMS
jgi:hypothetical protein